MGFSPSNIINYQISCCKNQSSVRQNCKKIFVAALKKRPSYSYQFCINPDIPINLHKQKAKKPHQSDTQLITFAYTRLLNKLYENEVILR